MTGFISALQRGSGRAVAILLLALCAAVGAGQVPLPAQDPRSGLYGYRDAAGVWTVPATWASAGAFSGGLAFVERPDGSGGLINVAGDIVTLNVAPAVWSSGPVMTEAKASEGLLAARDFASDKVGFVDDQGRWVIQPRFADAFEFREGLAAFRMREEGGVGFIDRRGVVVIRARFGTHQGAPPVFSEGLAAVGLDDDWPRTNLDPPGHLGYIDRQGRWALRPKYASGTSFRNGLAQAVLNGRKVTLVHPGKQSHR
jgi:hypothetical protein